MCSVGDLQTAGAKKLLCLAHPGRQRGHPSLSVNWSVLGAYRAHVDTEPHCETIILITRVSLGKSDAKKLCWGFNLLALYWISRLSRVQCNYFHGTKQALSWQMPAVVQNFLAKSDKSFPRNCPSGIDQPRLSNWQCFQIKGEKYEEQACYNLLYQGRQYVFFHLQPSQKCGIGRALDLASNLHRLDLWFARSKVHQEMAPPLRPKVSKRTKRLTSLHDEFHIYVVNSILLMCWVPGKQTWQEQRNSCTLPFESAREDRQPRCSGSKDRKADAEESLDSMAIGFLHVLTFF